jgi:phosphatidyl-myo-inositol dimannoside synthase
MHQNAVFDGWSHPASRDVALCCLQKVVFAMRVLVLSSGAYGVNGGIGLYNRDIVEALAAMDSVREIVLLPQLIQRPVEDLPPKVRHNAKAARGKISFVGASLAELRHAFDMIVVGHINQMPLAASLNLKWRAPLVLMVYGIDVWTQPKPWSKFLAGQCDAIWSISQVTTERMNSWAALPPAKYGQLPNAIQLDRYGVQGNQAAIRERHGLSGRTLLMTLARLPGFDRYKGVDEILECLPALREEDPTIAYMVVGDGEDRPRLEAKAQSLGLAEHVTFVGYVDECDKADYYRAADLFVMPGRGEGFGFVFLEALACGVPCVGSGIDGSKEALRNGLLGEIPDPREPAQILAAIRKALKKPRGVPAGLDYFAWPSFAARVRDAVGHLEGIRAA